MRQSKNALTPKPKVVGVRPTSFLIACAAKLTFMRSMAFTHEQDDRQYQLQ